MIAPSPPRHLSVVVPAFNEATRIGGTVEAILAYLLQLSRASELVVVDDGSRDDTAGVAARAAQAVGGWPQVAFYLVVAGRNRGKGSAVRRGMLSSRGDFALFCDADLSTPIEQWDRFAALHEGGADLCIGSRALPDSLVEVHQPWWREAMGKVFSRIKGAIVLPGVADSQCGFKSFSARARRLIFSRQRVDGFAFDVEILVLARALGLRVEQVPVRWRDTPGSRVHPVTDAAAMLVDLARIRRNLRRGVYRLEAASREGSA